MIIVVQWFFSECFLHLSLCTEAVCVEFTPYHNTVHTNTALLTWALSMKNSREQMPAILSSSLVFSALVSGRNTAPMTGDRQTFLTTARGLDEAGSNRYTAVVRDTCLK